MTTLSRALDQVERAVRILRKVDVALDALGHPRQSLRKADSGMSAAVVARRNPTLDTAARAATQLGSWMTHAGVIGSTAVATARTGRRRPLAYAVVSMSGTSLIYTGLKHSLRRNRPSSHEHLVRTRDPAFPSGHSATAAAAARTLAELYGLPKAPLALGSMLVPLTRVYLGVHHPSDVVAGWLLGWAWASLAAVIIRPHERGSLPARAEDDRSHEDEAASVTRLAPARYAWHHRS